MAGRPSKCTPEVIEAIADAVRDGLNWKSAAQAGGVCEQTLITWREKALEGESPYLELLEALKDAETDFKRSNLNVIRRAANEPSTTITEVTTSMPGGPSRTERKVTTTPPTWQPAAWLLERRYPDEFARTERRQHEGAVPVDVQNRDVRITLVQADGGEQVTERKDAQGDDT